MTAVQEQQPARPPAGSKTGRPSKRVRSTALGELGAYVESRITRLTGSLDRPGTRAQLAHLRAAAGREPGSVPNVWEVTIGGLPGPQPTQDAPTSTEWACHTALTLFAIHQQAKSEPMHVPGWGLGAAVAKLGDVLNRPDAVRRRFDAVATASSPEECAHHLRGLATQFRAENVTLDYAQLADDLAQFHRRGADAVRRRWGRQYYRLDRTQQPTTPTAITTENDGTTTEIETKTVENGDPT